MTGQDNNAPASLWRRLAAMFYDSFLIMAIWMVVAFIVLSLFGIDNARTVEGDTVTLDPLYKNILFAAMLFSAWAFYGWFWTHSGQTLGMQAWRIRVENADGSRISIGQSVIRFFVAIPSLLVLGLGYLCMLADTNRQTLPDRFSHSRVVKVPPMENR